VGAPRGRRDHDRAQLDGGQHDLPQSHHIAEHDQQAIARANAQRTQEIGDLIGTAREVGEAQSKVMPRIIDQPQRRPRVAGVPRLRAVLAAYRGLALERRIALDGWTTLVLRRGLRRRSVVARGRCRS